MHRTCEVISSLFPEEFRNHLLIKSNDKDVEELRCEVYVENKQSYKLIKSLGFKEEIYRNPELAHLADL